jgi:hypothetical protein
MDREELAAPRDVLSLVLALPESIRELLAQRLENSKPNGPRPSFRCDPADAASGESALQKADVGENRRALNGPLFNGLISATKGQRRRANGVVFRSSPKGCAVDNKGTSHKAAEEDRISFARTSGTWGCGDTNNYRLGSYSWYRRCLRGSAGRVGQRSAIHAII